VTRAFVALRPPDAVLDAIEARCARARLPEGGRWTPRAQRHVTVQFLGDDVDVDAVAGALSGVRAQVRELRLSGAGTLPPERRSRYLVLFVCEGREWLEALGDAVAARLAPLGIAREARDFTPHLTLARFKRPANLRATCAAIGREPVEPGWRVAEMVLFESRLGPGPAQHLARAVFPFDAPSAP
jgi:2'-5' RNA ligase